MRRFALLLIATLLAAGLGCNFSAAVPTPTAEPTDTPLAPTPTITLAPTATPLPLPEWGQICVLAYEDKNQNAMLDDGEQSLPGIRFSLLKGSMEIKRHLSTGDPELFCFNDLPAGNYEVQANILEDFRATNPTILSLELNPNGRLPVILGFVKVEQRSVAKVLALNGDPALEVIAVRPAGQNFYLVSADALQRTDNGGEAWHTVGDRPPARNVVMSPADPNVLLAGEGLDCFRGGPDLPMFISLDAGGHWSELSAGMNLRPLSLHPSEPAIAWAAGCDGLYRTEDAGESWQHFPADVWGLYSLESIQAIPEQPELLYASGNSKGGSGTILRSEDGGQSWYTIVEELELWVSDLLVNPADPDEIWFTSPSGVWHSQNRGQTWSESAAGLEAVAVDGDYLFEGKGLYALARDSSGVLYLGAEQGLFLSDDGGAQWQIVEQKVWENQAIQGVRVSETGSLWVTVPGGVFTLAPEG